MKIPPAHSWDVTPKQAGKIQLELASKVIRKDGFGEIEYVAGIDVGFEDNNTVTRAAIVVLSFPELGVVEKVIAKTPTSFPYVPGLLSFREIPAILKALKKIKILPQVFLCDGQGIAHPRRIGLASHLGVILNLPTVGVAKSRLIGSHGPLKEKKGSQVDLIDNNELIGMVLRTRDGVKPLYISIGHKISLESAVKLVMQCVTKYRLPETTRAAHNLASKKKSEIRISKSKTIF